MSSAQHDGGYDFRTAAASPSHGYLLPAVTAALDGLALEPPGRRLFELGCGNGSVARVLHERGWAITGIDGSPEGIALANRAYPHLDLRQASAYDDLAAAYGRFPVVVSLEVVEHLYSPRVFAARAFDLLLPGGALILSTPYHGYLKNLALAITGKMDAHFTALWDHGHIKFWSVRTLSQLLTEAGFTDLRFTRVGRVPALAKSMVVVARRPG